MPHHRKLTDTKRRQIIVGRAEGTPATDLARRFNVSRRAIYDTLRRAQDPGTRRTAGSRTVSTRLSDLQLAAFDAGLARRGITDQPAALRRLLGAADILLRPVDPVVLNHLQAWGAQVATDGAAINHIARKLNEAKLRGRPIPYTDDDMTTIRTFAGGLVDFADEFRILWEAQLAATTRQVDKALEGLQTKGPEERYTR